MKSFLFSIVLFGLVFCASAQILTNLPSRLKTKIISYEGKIGSDVSCSTVSFVPEKPGTGGSNTVTSPGHESELKWSFVGRNRNKDVYRFTFKRLTNTDSSNQTTTTKDVQFEGKQVIIFKADLHAVVIESPSEKDLKSAHNH